VISDVRAEIVISQHGAMNKWITWGLPFQGSE